MFESILKFFKRKGKNEDKKEASNSRDTAKERLHLVLMQDRANVSADFLELMKQEIIEVIKKYIEIDEGAIDVRLTNKENEDGTNGAPALYANIPILNIKNEARKTEKEVVEANRKKAEEKDEQKVEEKKENDNGKTVREDSVEKDKKSENNKNEQNENSNKEKINEQDKENNKKNNQINGNDNAKKDNKEEKVEKPQQKEETKEKVKSVNK